MSDKVTITIRLDPRPFQRACKGAESRLDDLSRPKRALAVRQITATESVRRKALGEFER